MVRLRPFKQQDINVILPWLEDERVFAMWCAGIFSYPLTKEQVSAYMEKNNGWSMAAVDDHGALIGHLRMWADYEKNNLHLGMIVVDGSRRGQGFGYQMVEKAVRYGFDILGVSRVTLGVFVCNPRAHACYKKVGFEDEAIEERAYDFHGELWNRQLMAIMKEK